jgi:isocitrate/isopropylmalate dehydrogenase
MRTYKIATIGGDGIGPEVVEAGVQVLKVCAERDGGFTLDVRDFKWGSDYYRKHGFMMPTDGADQLRKFDAILFGAVGAPDIPDHITSPYGGCAWPSASCSTSTPMYARPGSCPASPARCATSPARSWTG